MSSFALRLLALLSMIIDHAGLALFPNIGAFRCVGRLSFPLVCFLLAQGFVHSRQLRAYARRLLLFALLSEIPFDLLTFGRLSSSVEQNPLFSLLLGLMALRAVHAYRTQPAKAALWLLLLCLGAMLSRVSYGWLGVMLCVSFYMLREKPIPMALCAGVILLFYSVSLHPSGVTLSWVLVSLCAPLSLLPLLCYSGRRGAASPLLSLLFYAAYPLHMIALVILRAMRIVPPYFF